MDLTNLGENLSSSSVLSTPMKQHGFFPSTAQRSPSIPYRSPPSNSDVDILQNHPNLVPSCLSTPNPSAPNFPSRFRADIVKLVESSNVHKHSDTCYKYSKSNQDNKKICRMRMPRKLVPVSTIDPQTGHIMMRRSDPMINNFNEYLIAACRSNMDIKFIWTGNDAKALVYYITDYVTKMSLSFHDTYALVQKSIASMMNPTNQTNNENAIEKSRKLVLRCYNALASQQELSGVQVASYLMNWNDHYTTHKFQGLYLIQTERYLQAQLDEIRSKQRLEISTESEYLFIDFRVILSRRKKIFFFLKMSYRKSFFFLSLPFVFITSWKCTYLFLFL